MTRPLPTRGGRLRRSHRVWPSTKYRVDARPVAQYVVPVEGAVPARAGLKGNPVEIRDCPAAVSGNDPRHWHWPERLGSDAQ